MQQPRLLAGGVVVEPGGGVVVEGDDPRSSPRLRLAHDRPPSDLSDLLRHEQGLCDRVNVLPPESD